MQNLNNLNNLNALGIKGNRLFDPSQIIVGGEKVLLQQLLTKQRPTIEGIVYDERKNKGSARPIQLGRCYLFDGVNDSVLVNNPLTFNKFEGYIKFAVDDQQIWYASGLSVSLEVISGVLSITSGYSLTEIYVDGVLKTDAEAGALLNDNQWHYLSVVLDNDLTPSSLSFATNGTDYGNISTFGWKFLYGDTVAMFYKMDEQDDIYCYDSAGYALHGAILNATLSSFHTTQNIYSYQNELGYSKPNGIYIPRDENIPTQDVTGEPLQYTGQVPYNASLKSSSCLDFNGTNQYADAGVGLTLFDNSTNAFKIRAKFIPDTVTGIHRLVSQQIGSGAFTGVSLYTNGPSLRLDVMKVPTTDQLIAMINGLALVAGTYYDIEVTYTGNKLVSGVTWVVNGVSYSSAAFANTLTSTDITSGVNLKLARDNSSLYLDGKLMYAEVLDGSGVSQAKYTLSEGVGTVIYDVSGNGRHMNLFNAPTWTTQDNYHANIVNGFRPYIKFDGVNDYIAAPTSLSSAMNLSGKTLRFTGYFTYDSTAGCLFGKGGLNGGYLLFPFNSNTVRLALKQSGNSTDYIAYFSTKTFTEGVRYKFDITFTESTCSMVFDDVADTVIVTSPTGVYGDSPSVFTIGARENGASFFSDTVLWDLKCYSNSVLQAEYKLADIGATAKDSSGNGHNGTIFGSPSILRIPAKTSLLDAIGMDLTNPAGAYHNGAETQIDFTGGIASPESVRNAWESTWTFNTARTNPEFKRTLTSGGVDKYADRFLAYRDALSGTNLSKVNKYVTTKAI